MQPYSPARGGPAPHDLRAAFATAAALLIEGRQAPPVTVRGLEVPAVAAVALLVNCRDPLPEDLAEWLRLAARIEAATYAEAARALRGANCNL